MVLTDHEIHACTSKSGLIENFDPDCFTNIGYDLRADKFYTKTNGVSRQILKSGESVFVGAMENIKLPNDMIARVVLKNSRIRQGFSLEAPVYQPGHHTKVFFRLTNVSNDEIELQSSEKYATIMFDKLSMAADKPYEGTFSEEMNFSGMGEYTGIYEKEIRKIERKKEDIKDLEKTIYSNVLVILTVFVALFSFLTTNLSLFSSSANAVQFLLYNFVMLGCISFLVALLNRVTGETPSAWYGQILKWIPALLCFAVALILFLSFPACFT